jgi:hypothetical protein
MYNIAHASRPPKAPDKADATKMTNFKKEKQAMGYAELTEEESNSLSKFLAHVPLTQE